MVVFAEMLSGNGILPSHERTLLPGDAIRLLFHHKHPVFKADSWTPQEDMQLRIRGFNIVALCGNEPLILPFEVADVNGESSRIGSLVAQAHWCLCQIRNLSRRTRKPNQRCRSHKLTWLGIVLGDGNTKLKPRVLVEGVVGTNATGLGILALAEFVSSRLSCVSSLRGVVVECLHASAT